MSAMRIDAPDAAAFNPIDELEKLFRDNDWLFVREGEEELSARMSGGWCEYRLRFLWPQSGRLLLVGCRFDIPPLGRAAVALPELVNSVNRRLWTGHFVCDPGGGVAYRCALPIAKTGFEQEGFPQHLLETAMGVCERFYPAFQLLLRGEKTPKQALAAAMPDCVGHA